MTPRDCEDCGYETQAELARFQIYMDDIEQDLTIRKFPDYILRRFGIFEAINPKMQNDTAQIKVRFFGLDR